MKKLLTKYREIIMYLIFGVLTTVISWVTYFIIITVFGSLSGADDASGEMQAIRVAANVISWIFGVLFSFFTNKAYVFEDKNSDRKHVTKKLIEFSSSRLLTLMLEIFVVWATVEVLLLCRYEDVAISLFNFELRITMDLIAKLISAVLVVISNYILSKLIVFRKKK